MNRQSALFVIAIIGALVASTYIFEKDKHSLMTQEQVDIYLQFAAWTDKHAKNYREQQEKAYRYLKFKENLQFIRNHNKRYAKGLQTFEVALNQFADMDNFEFAALYNKKKPVSSTNKCKTQLDIKTDLPDQVDWSDKAVNPVRNQGMCGSCWAFSACGALEGLNAVKNNKLDVFSTQQLVDCAGGSYGNEGCNGGQMNAAFWYVIDNGIALEKSYPYKGKDQKCQYKPSMKAFGISSCADIKANSTSALKSAVYTQPVAIAVEADTLQFQFYSKGVFSGKCGTDLDHGILLTGYGMMDDKMYWKCKNSWGPSWGMSGYILIARDESEGQPGQCGILMENAVPLA